ncbi:MAG TPA: TRL domain-containing protein [Bacteroidia bacterium]|nr:TRL domain-containing protein [Bacteroidia bacterium]
MKKIKTVLASAAVALFMASCSYTAPAMLTQNSVGTKVGKSSGTVYLGVLSFGADWGLQTAAKNGGISKIATVDIKVTNVLYLIMTYETTVTGE